MIFHEPLPFWSTVIPGGKWLHRLSLRLVGWHPAVRGNLGALAVGCWCVIHGICGCLIVYDIIYIWYLNTDYVCIHIYIYTLYIHTIYTLYLLETSENFSRKLFSKVEELNVRAGGLGFLLFWRRLLALLGELVVHQVVQLAAKHIAWLAAECCCCGKKTREMDGKLEASVTHQWHSSDTSVFFHQQTRPQMGRDCLEHCHGQFLGITSPMISMGFGSSWLTTWSSKNGTDRHSFTSHWLQTLQTHQFYHSYRCLDLTHTLFTTSILRIYRGFTLWSYTSYTYFYPYYRS